MSYIKNEEWHYLVLQHVAVIPFRRHVSMQRNLEFRGFTFYSPNNGVINRCMRFDCISISARGGTSHTILKSVWCNLTGMGWAAQQESLVGYYHMSFHARQRCIDWFLFQYPIHSNFSTGVWSKARIEVFFFSAWTVYSRKSVPSRSLPPSILDGNSSQWSDIFQSEIFCEI